MNRSRNANNKIDDLTTRRRASPFKEWGKLRPSKELEDWRKVNEPIIVDALRSKERLETLIDELSNDACVFCDACDGAKCWGTIYPICAPILKKFTEIVEK
jgi:hypothetical protein